MGAVRDARTLRSSSADSAFGAALQLLSGELYKGETLWIVAVEEPASRSSKAEPPASPQRSSLPLNGKDHSPKPPAAAARRRGLQDLHAEDAGDRHRAGRRGVTARLSFRLIHSCSRRFSGGRQPGHPCCQGRSRTVVNGSAQSSKACEGATLPWVQIPPPPPLSCDDASPDRMLDRRGLPSPGAMTPPRLTAPWPWATESAAGSCPTVPLWAFACSPVISRVIIAC
jgi:hypothetical protein